MYVCKGNVKIGTQIPIIAGHPIRKPKTIAAPIIPKGNIMAANPIGALNYIKLKSFESMFVTFPNEDDLITY
jgi:hypothetical protein